MQASLLMRITSWNVNGLRKLKPLHVVFDRLQSDIICIQETRISRDNETSELESVAFVPGYNSFFSICRTRTGYSGVATYCKKRTATPKAACEGLSDDTGGGALCLTGGPCPRRNDLASSPFRCACHGSGYTGDTLNAICEEGRVVVTDHHAFVLINVYVPATGGIEERVAFKQSFLHALHAKIDALRAAGRHVIVAGDMNISPARIDSAERMSGCAAADPHWDYASSSRVWLRTLLNTGAFVDSFRKTHPNRTAAYTCWSEATQGRQLNYGVRIDLIIVDTQYFNEHVSGADILPEVMGSDHCPVFVEIKDEAVSCETGLEHPRQPPAFCTQFLPRFAKRQQTITRFFNDGPPVVASSASNSSLELDIPPVPNSPPSSPIRSNPPKVSLKPISKKPRAQNTTCRKTNPNPKKIARTQTTLRSYNSLLKHKREPSSRSDTDNECSLVVKPESTPENGVDENGDSDKANISNSRSSSGDRCESAKAWRKLLSGPPPPPLCRHGNPCVLKTVTKAGENKGKTFFSCAYPRGIGAQSNCNFFMWAPFNSKFPTTPR